MQVLFICQANQCRSALAEGFARKLAGERSPLEPVAFRSCGLMAIAGRGALPQAVRAAAAYGVDLASHEATPFGLDLADWADYLVAMTRAQKRELLMFAPMLRPRAYTLAEFAQETTGRRPAWRDVSDPVGRTDAHFRRCALRIHDALVPVMDALSGIEAPRPGILECLLRPR